MLDTLITDEDMKNINKLNEIKKDIMSYIDMDKFIDLMRDAINKSENFEFKSERSSRFIEKDQPNFILKSKLLAIDKKTVNDKQKLNKITEDICQLVFEEIISEVSKELSYMFKDNENIDNLFKDIPEDLKDIYLTNIYTIRLNPVENIINILYFI